MASFALQQNPGPPFVPGAPFAAKFTTMLSASSITRPRASPRIWASPPPWLPPGAASRGDETTATRGLGNRPPTPNSASSSEPFFDDNRTPGQVAVAVITIVVLALAMAPCIAAYYSGRYRSCCRRRRHRCQTTITTPLVARGTPSRRTAIPSPREVPRAHGGTGSSWEDPEARAAVREQLEAHYRSLRAEGLNELDEPPPPYKADEAPPRHHDHHRDPPTLGPQFGTRATTMAAAAAAAVPPGYHGPPRARDGGRRAEPATPPTGGVAASEPEPLDEGSGNIELRTLHSQSPTWPQTSAPRSSRSTPVEGPLPSATSHPPSPSPSPSSPSPLALVQPAPSSPTPTPQAAEQAELGAELEKGRTKPPA
ncbi:hypothetical protein VTG60DRAFT_3940 [Thermothelomyces hinnuleus]